MNKINNKSMFVLLSILSFPSVAETLFSDDFQDGDISDWQISGVGNDAIANLYNGNYSLRLQNKKSALQTISTAGFDNVSIDASVVGYLLESTDTCIAELSVDNGANWLTIEEVVNGQDDGVTWYSGSISPTGASDNAALQIRARANATDNADNCYFDNITVQGDPIVAPATLPFSDNLDAGWSAWIADNGNATAATGVSQETGIYVWSGNAIKLRGSANLTKTFSTLGKSNIVIDWHLLGGWLEAGESCDIQVNTGSGYSTIASVSNGEDDWYYRNGSVKLSSDANNLAQLHVRMQGNSNNEYNNNDYDVCYTDEFSIYSAAQAPEITITGSTDFGDVVVNQTSSLLITVANEGTADLLIGSIYGADSSGLSISSETCVNQTLSPNSSCNINIQYAPTSEGTLNELLTITNNDADESSATLTLTGNAIAENSGSVYDPLSGSGAVNRTLLTSTALNSTSFNLVDYSAFAVPNEAANPTNNFQGSLVLTGESTTGNLQEQGTSIAGSYTDPEHLPEFDFEFVQEGTHIIPVQRGLIPTEHPSWHYILEPGRVWNENNDNGFSRASIPFALQEAGANCTHNGVLSFLFKTDGSISNVAYQIATETCAYFKYDSWGILDASYTPSSVVNAGVIANNYQAEVARRMPTKTIADLTVDFPTASIDTSKIGSDQASADQTVYGVVIDGINYVSSCKTRRGDYPYCEVMSLPSYSTAKSVVGAVGLMRLEQKYPGTKNTNVSLCSNSTWSQVSFENLLDMSTGRYTSSGFEVDEGDSTTANNFFLKYSHTEKLNHSCSYTQKVSAGTTWVYHTSDTYLLGAEMNDMESTDLWDMLNNDLWTPLGLSPAISTTSRTNDSVVQPWSGQAFTGYGLTYHHDDIVKIAEFLHQDNGVINGTQVLDQTMLNEVLQTTPHGLNAGSQYDSYDNGFWIWNAQEAFSCTNSLAIPYMSGYGGIVVSLLPNDTIYYAFSDSEDYGQINTAKELHKVRAMCN
ncbi:choice-of-anchor D domain-containing protein [Thalassotalea castellviae]|uniref:Choice-of-anchor D domain-containing protein n=1 Tax=Thalassotalea castellviae TaxID=3075612 RepID=A0ABU2ZY70_9GAMM|nr:choice-of-anchor D domain-containing protein [Thalassotalea sp. W431]MDT0602267.1 choice-of-anchor D domain-containing protein [Thalassotalea sp. W431]